MSVDVSPDPLDPANPPDLDWMAKDPDLSALSEEPDLAPFAEAPNPEAYEPTPRDRAAERARLEATRPDYREARTVGDAFRDAFSPKAREAWEQVALSGLGNPPQERLNPDD